MTRGASSRRLIINADDFGASRAINAAVIEAHCRGVLTTASLMVTGAACEEAVELARANPRLGVGLHLTLVCGKSALPAAQAPGLVNERAEFSPNPVLAGCRFFFRRGLREQLREELAAQFGAFQATGLPLDHVNGHLNLHLHPTVLGLLLRHGATWGLRRLRLTRDPFGLNARLASGRWAYRLSHAAVFGLLGLYAAPRLRRAGIRHTQRVFGLLQNGRVHEDYLLRLLPALPPGDSELYSHPSLDEFRLEFEALVSARVKALLERLGIARVRYQDL